MTLRAPTWVCHFNRKLHLAFRSRVWTSLQELVAWATSGQFCHCQVLQLTEKGPAWGSGVQSGKQGEKGLKQSSLKAPDFPALSGASLTEAVGFLRQT